MKNEQDGHVGSSVRYSGTADDLHRRPLPLWLKVAAGIIVLILAGLMVAAREGFL